MNEFLEILIMTTVLLVLLSLFICDWALERRIKDITVSSWQTQWVNFGIFVWLILIVVFFIQQLALLVPANALGEEDDPLRLLLPAIAMHLAVIVTMLIGTSRMSEMFPSPTRGLRPIAAAPLGIVFCLAGLPLVCGTAILWNYLLTLWQRFGVAIDTPKQELVEILQESDSTLFLVAVLFVAVVLAPISEELVFRRGIYRFLKGRIPPILALTVSSLMFAAIHFNIQSFLALFALGMLFGRAYERTGSISTPILFHSCFNLLAIVTITFASGEYTVDPTGALLAR